MTAASADADARLFGLAREAARGRHHAARDDYSTDEWMHHAMDFATCPHPDCVLVRATRDDTPTGDAG